MELTKLDDSASSRIKTDTVFGRFVREGYRVHWIEWDSAFRDTDLQLGDVVIALNGQAYTDVHDGNKNGSAIGRYGESYYWEQNGGKEGDKVVLTVIRDATELEIKGELRADRFYYNTEKRLSLGPGGPDRLKNDGFTGAWSSWYEQVIKAWSLILDDGWNRTRLNNRKALAEHLEHEPRIQYLQDKHPGQFADTMRADYDRVIECLRGKRYSLTDEDLAYRELGEQRKQIATTAAQSAWQNISSALGSELIEAFPAAEPDKRAAVVGKRIELPWILPRQIINDLGISYAVFGSRYDGYYFIDLSSERAQRFYTVFYRYVAMVNPSVRERYSFIAEILDEPRMITFQRQAVTGLLVDIIAGRAGEGEGEMFVDLRDAPPDNFAAENDLKTLVKVGELTDDLSPSAVIETMIRAVQQADFVTWKQVFADWRAWSRENGEVYLNRAYTLPDHVFNRPWERSRRNLVKEVYDSRVSKESTIITLTEAKPDLNIPRIQQVMVYVDHIGLFEEEYRAFNNVNVNRTWVLQRLGDGPWRVTDVRSL